MEKLDEYSLLEVFSHLTPLEWIRISEGKQKVKIYDKSI